MDVGRPFCFLARLAAKAAQRPPFNSGAYGQSNLFLPRHFAACLSLALDNLSVKPLGGGNQSKHRRRETTSFGSLPRTKAGLGEK